MLRNLQYYTFLSGKKKGLKSIIHFKNLFKKRQIKQSKHRELNSQKKKKNQKHKSMKFQSQN